VNAKLYQLSNEGCIWDAHFDGRGGRRASTIVPLDLIFLYHFSDFHWGNFSKVAWPYATFFALPKWPNGKYAYGGYAHFNYRRIGLHHLQLSNLTPGSKSMIFRVCRLANSEIKFEIIQPM